LTTPNQLKTYGTIKSYSGSWVIECDPHVLLRMRRVFPRMSRPRYQEGKLREVVCLMDTPEICRELEWFQSRFPFDYLVKADEHRLAKRAGEHREEGVRRSSDHRGQGTQAAGLQASASAARLSEGRGRARAANARCAHR